MSRVTGLSRRRRALSLPAMVLVVAVIAGACAAPVMIVTPTPSPTPSGTGAAPLRVSTTPTRSVSSTAGTATSTATSAVPSTTPPRGAIAVPTPRSDVPLAGRTVPLGQPVLLRPTIEVQLAGTQATLILEAVTEDSRCPVDVTCVRAGSVTATFSLWDGRQAVRDEVTLRGVEPARLVLGGFELTLLAIDPEPHSERPIKPFDYRAQVVIDRPVVRSVTGIDGMVTLGPNCPVVRADQPCPDRPYEATLVVRNAAGVVVARVQSNAAGRFALDVPAGRYVVDPLAPGPGRYPAAAAVEVTVPAAARASVAVSYDTGIR